MKRRKAIGILRYIRILVFGCLGVFFSMSAAGDQWPVVTDVRIDRIDNMTSHYYVTSQLMDVVVPSCLQAVNAPTCYVVYGHRHWNAPGYASVWQEGGPGKSSEVANTSVSPSRAAVNLYRTTANAMVRHYGMDPVGTGGQRECVGWVIALINGEIDFGLTHSVVPCFEVGSSNDWCKITSPELVLNFGIVSLQNGIGKEARDEMEIQCTTPMVIRLSLRGGGNEILLDDYAGRVELTQGLGQMILFGGTSRVPVEGKIRSLTSIGELYGSSVLVIEPL